MRIYFTKLYRFMQTVRRQPVGPGPAAETRAVLVQVGRKFWVMEVRR